MKLSYQFMIIPENRFSFQNVDGAKTMKIAGLISLNIDDKKFINSLNVMKRNSALNTEIIRVSKNFIIGLTFFNHENYHLDDQKDFITVIIFDQVIEGSQPSILKTKVITSPEDIKNLNALIIKYDKNKKQLFVYSDYFGLKTLYYTAVQNDFFFSSEIKGIINYYGKAAFSLNRKSLIEMILYQFQWGQSTLLNEISIVEPKKVIRYSSLTNEVSLTSYTNFPKEIIDFNVVDSESKIYTLFSKNLENLKKDARKIMWLSGGLDSRLILAMLIKTGINIDAIINFGYKRNNEYKFAQKIIKHYDLEDKLIHYEVNSELVATNAKRHLWISEGYNNHLVSFIKLGLRQATGRFPQCNFIIYDGYFGDVVLGGSNSESVQSKLFSELQIDRKYLMQTFTDEFRVEVENYDNSRFNQVKELNYDLNESTSRIHEYLVYDNYARRKIRSGGPLLGEDYGIVHLPFFGREFFDHAIKIPLNHRKDRKIYLKVYKKFFPEITKIPSTSLVYLNRAKQNKVKQYFSELKLLTLRGLERITRLHLLKSPIYVDPNEWLRKSTSYRELIESVLFDPRTERRRLFNIPVLRKMFREHMQRKHNYGYVFTVLFDIEMTLRMFLDVDYDPFKEFPQEE